MVQRRTLHSCLGAVAALALSLSLAGCTGADSSDTDADSAVPTGGTLTVGILQPDSLNPALAIGRQTPVVCLAYDSLIAEDSDGTFSPRLATEWGYADDENKVFELTIREGVTFSDGDELNAQAVADSLNYFVEAGGSSVAYYGGFTAAATGEYTVQVTSPTPEPDFEILLTEFYNAGCIISPTGVANPDALENESHGVGPYVIDSVQTGVEIVFKANEDYYDPSRVLYDEIVMKVFDSDTAATQALLSGQISFWTAEAAGQSWYDLAEANDLVVHPGTPQFAELYLCDVEGEVTPALGDVRVRQALNYAIDRDAITAAIYGPDATARVQPANGNWAGFDEELEEWYPYDPDKARELLEQAGYGDGFTLPLTYNGPSTDITNLAQTMSSYLADVGVTLDLKPAAVPADLIPTLASGTVSGGFFTSDARSVYKYVVLNYGPNGVNANTLGQVDEELVALADASAIVNTDASRQEILAWLTENAFSVQVAQTSNIYVTAPDIDVYISSSGRVDYARFQTTS